MNITKSKIYELWNTEHSKVIKYRQVIRNNVSNELKSIETESLNDLLKEVKIQISKWNDIS